MRRGAIQFLGTAARYFVNAVNLARQQEGWRSAAATAVSLSTDEARKIPRFLHLRWKQRGQQPEPPSQAPVLDVPEILRQLTELGIDFKVVTLDRDALLGHISAFPYPRFYAGGSVASGGVREAKIMEYFLSLWFLPVAENDVVIDVASERSVFPVMVAKTIGAQVFRQDLVYSIGMNGDRIGGSADSMPVPNDFADKLFLHNSFEHFEGDIDTRFIYEAWRILKPGGGACIVPLYLSTHHQNLTDPLVDTRGVVWDADAEVVQRVGHHVRFGRAYSARTLAERVLEPARECGFKADIYSFADVDLESDDPISRAQGGLRFAMVLSKR
jgi:SAM-dependent methyltransferase